MARSFTEAFATVDGPELELAIGLRKRSWPKQPAPREVETTFERFDYRHVRRIERELGAEFHCHLTYAEEAVQQAQVQLLETRPELFSQDPLNWLGLLHTLARFQMYAVVRSLRGIESLEHLRETVGEAQLNASPCIAASAGETEDCRQMPLPVRGRSWERAQVIGALQRFCDHHHRPPRARECRALNQLPSNKVISRLFGNFHRALLAAGMVPTTASGRFKPWSAYEAARECLSFKRRNGRWPDGSDADRRSSGLPNRAAMIRFFGGTRCGEVQQKAEAILASVAQKELTSR